MKLYYYNKHDNFGDLLNLWLWPKLIPELLQEDSEILFVGIGTLLNEHIPLAKQTVVFGTGVGYGTRLPQVNENWKFYCLRGPLSARALAMPESLGIADPGVLLHRFFTPAEKRSYRYSYMPHFSHAEAGNASWSKICEILGFGYIDPRNSVTEVMKQVADTEVLLTEAMHGAIAAEALRVPWIPISTSSGILAFKWQDWCSSIELQYQPLHLLRLCDPIPGDLGSRVRNSAKFPIALGQLFNAARSQPYLAKDSTFKMRVAQLEESLAQLRRDVGAGSLAI